MGIPIPGVVATTYFIWAWSTSQSQNEESSNILKYVYRTLILVKNAFDIHIF